MSRRFISTEMIFTVINDLLNLHRFARKTKTISSILIIIIQLSSSIFELWKKPKSRLMINTWNLRTTFFGMQNESESEEDLFDERKERCRCCKYKSDEIKRKKFINVHLFLNDHLILTMISMCSIQRHITNHQNLHNNFHRKKFEVKSFFY